MNTPYKLAISDCPHPINIILFFNKTAKGWIITHNQTGAKHNCAPSAERVLKQVFQVRNRCYPNTFFKALAHVWEELDTGNITRTKAEQYFAELSEWISQTNISSTSFY